MNFVSPETAVPESAEEAELGALLSITRRMNGFLYRCQNDASYTMLYMTDGITPLTEYPASDFIGNRVRAFTSICHPDDLTVVDKAVGAALEERVDGVLGGEELGGGRAAPGERRDPRVVACVGRQLGVPGLVGAMERPEAQVGDPHRRPARPPRGAHGTVTGRVRASTARR